MSLFFLPLSNTVKHSNVYVNEQGRQVAAASSIQGYRVSMEDAHIMQPMTSRPDHLFLAVFDGHAGKQAALYARNHLMEQIELTREWTLYLETEDLALMSAALKTAFVELDRQLLKAVADTSGCTANVAILTPRFIVCANLGDSRCVLGSAGGCIELSQDHKPQNPAEKTRIIHAGGSVCFGRVDGFLAVSRAFGDCSFKQNPALGACQQRVSCEPDICVRERKPMEDDFLILACDGLWDVCKSENALLLARKLDRQQGESSSLVKIVEDMIDIALDDGSKDNITVIVARVGATDSAN